MAGNIIQNSTDKKAVYYTLKEIHHTFCGVTFMWMRRNLYRIFSECLDGTFVRTCFFFLHFFFFFFQAVVVDQVFRKQCFCALFTDPQITLFNNFFIKNGSHSTIYTFKNYFVIVFSVSVFNFSKNKLNPNGPIYSPPWLLIGESWYLTLLLLDGRSLL